MKFVNDHFGVLLTSKLSYMGIMLFDAESGFIRVAPCHMSEEEERDMRIKVQYLPKYLKVEYNMYVKMSEVEAFIDLQEIKDEA
jgi:hypothetical protein